MKDVQRRAGRCGFRFPLPDELAEKPFPAVLPAALVALVDVRTGQLKTEFIRSLQTTDGKEAAMVFRPEIPGWLDIIATVLARVKAYRISVPAGERRSDLSVP